MLDFDYYGNVIQKSVQMFLFNDLFVVGRKRRSKCMKKRFDLTLTCLAGKYQMIRQVRLESTILVSVKNGRKLAGTYHPLYDTRIINVLGDSIRHSVFSTVIEKENQDLGQSKAFQLLCEGRYKLTFQAPDTTEYESWIEQFNRHLLNARRSSAKTKSGARQSSFCPDEEKVEYMKVRDKVCSNQKSKRTAGSNRMFVFSKSSTESFVSSGSEQETSEYMKVREKVCASRTSPKRSTNPGMSIILSAKDSFESLTGKMLERKASTSREFMNTKIYKIDSSLQHYG